MLATRLHLVHRLFRSVSLTFYRMMLKAWKGMKIMIHQESRLHHLCCLHFLQVSIQTKSSWKKIVASEVPLKENWPPVWLGIKFNQTSKNPPKLPWMLAWKLRRFSDPLVYFAMDSWLDWHFGNWLWFSYYLTLKTPWISSNCIHLCLNLYIWFFTSWLLFALFPSWIDMTLRGLNGDSSKSFWRSNLEASPLSFMPLLWLLRWWPQRWTINWVYIDTTRLCLKALMKL